MEINWVTVAAQIVNFLFLVWLLRKFLYGPITRAMVAREEKIRKRLDDAANVKRQSEEETMRLRKERDDFSDQKEQLLIAAREDAETLRRTLENEARKDIEKERENWSRLLHSEKEDFFVDLQQRVAQEFFALAETVFVELADKNFERGVVKRFLENAAALSVGDIEKLKVAARREKFRGQILSRFELPPDERSKIEGAVNNVIGEKMTIQYLNTNAFASGVRLRIGGQTLEWSVAKYLDGLRNRLEEELPVSESTENKRAAE